MKYSVEKVSRKREQYVAPDCNDLGVRPNRLLANLSAEGNVEDLTLEDGDAWGVTTRADDNM